MGVAVFCVLRVQKLLNRGASNMKNLGMSKKFFAVFAVAALSLVAMVVAGGINSLMVGVAVVGVLACLAVTVAAARSIKAPMDFLKEALNLLGELRECTVSDEERRLLDMHSARGDEFGKIFTGMDALLEGLDEITKDIHVFSSGDFNIKAKPRCEGDLMAHSLLKLSDDFNTAFGEIKTSSDMVNFGASQVSDSAQALAAGTSEQSARLEELSASSEQILQMIAKCKQATDESMANSTNAVALMSKSKSSMQAMVDTMRSINESARNIGKVIKVIDDIAFQTNILALNAAVEAARAGQHGKGFAVVAEEVRNLASKSAEAAKDTGDMIQNSMEKAELGTQIAGETAESLKDIVNGISESSVMVSDIATASEEQSLGISQINTGIDQVAQVVQQNSATAEESAAASEEMSSQSTILEELISQFKLKSTNTMYKGLPASEKTYEALVKPELDNYATSSNGGDFGKY